MFIFFVYQFLYFISLSSDLIYISLSRSLSLPIRRIRRERWLAAPLDGVGGGRKRETIDAVGDGGFVLRSVAGGVGLCFAVWPVGWVSCGWWWWFYRSEKREHRSIERRERTERRERKNRLK